MHEWIQVVATGNKGQNQHMHVKWQRWQKNGPRVRVVDAKHIEEGFTVLFSSLLNVLFRFGSR